jgi:hypothetical protein
MDEEFAHGGGEGEFWGFAVEKEARAEGSDDGIVPRGSESGHVEGATSGKPSAVDMALTAEEAAVVVEGGEAGKGGGLIF